MTAEGLTEKQRRFVEEYAKNGFQDAKRAALEAGYSREVARNAYREILGSTSVTEEIQRIKLTMTAELQDRLLSEAEEAVKALAETVRNGKGGVRVAAAREILDRCGIIRTERREQMQGPVEIRVVEYEDPIERYEDRGE